MNSLQINMTTILCIKNDRLQIKKDYMAWLFFIVINLINQYFYHLNYVSYLYNIKYYKKKCIGIYKNVFKFLI